MKNSGARSSIIVGLGAAALMLTSIACGSSGGTTGTGGSGDNGGSTGTGGSAGSTGAAGAKAPVLSFTFDTTGSTQGFNLQTYVDTSMYKNLGALAGDAAVPADYPTLVQADGVGQGTPASGALKLTANFTDFQQYAEVKVGLSPPKDLSGTTLHAAVNVTSNFLGGAFIYAKAGGTYVYASSTGTGLTSGVFTPLSFNLDTAVGAGGAAFDPTMVQEIGVHIYSDGPFDGGTFAAATGGYVFYIDNVVAK
jgi:hypothetical protein